MLHSIDKLWAFSNERRMREDRRVHGKEVVLDAAKVRRELMLIRNDVLQDLRKEDV